MIKAETALRVLLDLTRALGEQEHGLDQALQLVSDAALTLLGGDHASIRVLEEGRQTLLCGARSGVGAKLRPVTLGRHTGIAGWVLESGEVARVADVSRDERYVVVAEQGFTIRSMLAMPLWSAGKVIGCLAVTSRAYNAFSEEDEAVGCLLANCAVPPIERARLQQLADTDAHTRAFNRGYLVRRLERELRRASEKQSPLCLSMLDLDHFKAVNDAHGHPAGDEVLRIFAARVRALVRHEDVFVRRGGEEFVLVMPNCELEAAVAAAERLRDAIGRHPMRLKDNLLIEQKVSIGVALWDGQETGAELEARADAALYAAKRGGRDRVCVAREVDDDESTLDEARRGTA